jgi:RNase H-like domain found in reverse transcriptase/Integrase zinc binding domain
VCVYTRDASHDFWSAIVTQVSPGDLDLPHEEQRHEPLAFLSGAFTGAMKRWAIIEKEAYAIVAGCGRLDWLLQRPDGFALFTDHNDLIYVFNPAGRPSSVSAHTAAQLTRWDFILSSYRYTIEHVSGSANVWSDMLTRWAAPSARARVCELLIAPLSPSLDEPFAWPDHTEIGNLQDAALLGDTGATTTAADLALTISEEGLYCYSQGMVWIPPAASDLQMRLCIVAHTGLGRHRGSATTLSTLKLHFVWDNMSEDVREFCASCLHCSSTIGGDISPGPLREALHASFPNEVIYFEFLYIGPSHTGDKYLLIVRDDLSGYVQLISSANSDALSVVDAILSWFKSFGVARM